MPDPTATKQAPARTDRPAPGRARKPAQIRSKARVEKLLDATVRLLEAGAGEIGLYDIAAAAGVPAGSVYHFFPSKEAAFLAVAERYELLLLRYLDDNTDTSHATSWPDLLTHRFAQAAAFYNANPAFAKLFLSGSMTAEIRGVDVENVQSLASSLYHWLDGFFRMPYLPDHEMKFTVLISLHDGIWMMSYARHGRITEAFAREARLASLAYCRTFLPEVIEHRPPEPGQERRPRRPRQVAGARETGTSAGEVAGEVGGKPAARTADAEGSQP